MRFVLVHSPFVAPAIWAPVADELRALGHEARAPDVDELDAVGDPGAVLVAYSGAGAALRGPARAYVFADALLPRAGTRFEEAPTAMQELVEAGGHFPDWTEQYLVDAAIPGAVAGEVVRLLRPRGLDFFRAPLPALGTWPDAPVAYLRWSEAYDDVLAEARRRGWPTRERDAHHFQLLAEPRQVAADLIELAGSLGA
jgi:hypothetical protein